MLPLSSTHFQNKCTFCKIKIFTTEGSGCHTTFSHRGHQNTFFFIVLFHKITELMVKLDERSQTSRMYHLGAMNICTKCFGNPLNSRDITVRLESHTARLLWGMTAFLDLEHHIIIHLSLCVIILLMCDNTESHGKRCRITTSSFFLKFNHGHDKTGEIQKVFLRWFLSRLMDADQ